MIYNRSIIVIHLIYACIIVDKLLKVFLFCVLSTYDVYKKKNVLFTSLTILL